MWTSLNITQILHKYSCFDYFRESRPTERLAVFRSGARPKQLPRRGRDGGARARLGILDSFKKETTLEDNFDIFLKNIICFGERS